MKSSKRITFLLLFTVLFIVLGVREVEGACLIPVNNTVVTRTTNTTLCVNESLQYINFSIIINANNIYLNCNYSTIVSSSIGVGYFFDTNFKSNISIYNCNIAGWKRGINLGVSENCSVYNNTINVSGDNPGIYIDRSNNNQIHDNYIFGNLNQSYVDTYANGTNMNGTAVQLAGSGSANNTNNSIYNNTFNLLKYGIYANSFSQYFFVYKNYMSNFGSNGYAIFTNTNDLGVFNVSIYNNIIFNGGWNAIDIRSSGAKVYGNNITNWYHHGIDTLIQLTPVAVPSHKNSIFNNNNLNDSGLIDPSFNTSSYCFYIQQIHDSLFENNTCINSQITGTGNYSETYNITLNNNTVINPQNSGIYIMINNSVVSNNHINNVLWKDYIYTFETGADYADKTKQVRISFINNTDNSGVNSYYFTYNGSQNITIEESSVLNHTFILPTQGASLGMKYNGIKNVNIYSTIGGIYANTTVSLWNQLSQSPFNDLLNFSSRRVLARNIDNYSLTLSPNEQIVVGNYSNCAVGNYLPFENLYVNQSITLCGGTYNLNDTDGNGAIIINNNSLTLDCNGSTIYGSFTNTTQNQAIWSVARTGVVIKNCNINGGYKYGMYMSGNNNNVNNCNFTGNFTDQSGKSIYVTSMSNSQIDNCIFNTTSYGIGGYGPNTNFNVTDNTFLNTAGYSVDLSGGNILISRNFFYDIASQTTYIRNLAITGGNRMNISYNYFKPTPTTGSGYVAITNITNGYFEYNTFDGSTSAATYVTSLDYQSSNWTIRNNVFSKVMSFKTAANYTKFYNNIFNDTNRTITEGIFITATSSYNIIDNNTIKNSAQYLNILGSYNNITNNNIQNFTLYTPIGIGTGSSYNVISNNTVNGADQGIVSKGSNDKIFGNTFLNVNTEYDNWGLGIYIVAGANNESVYNNTIINASGCGILIRNATNVYAYNNSVDLMSFQSKLSPFKNDQGEPSGAICVNEYYRNWAGLADTLSGNITTTTTVKSVNVTLLDNVFTNTSQFFIRSEGTVNLVHNLNPSMYWYRSFQFTYYQDKVEMWNNNNYSQILATYNIPSWDNKTLLLAFPYYYYCGGSALTPCNSTNNVTNTKFRYTMNKTSMTFTRWNDTNIVQPSNVSIFSASSWSPYNDVYNVSGGYVLSFDVDNFSVSLSPGSVVSVGDFGSLPAPVFFSPIGGGGGGGSPVSLTVLCPGNLSWNGSVCVDLGLPMSFARIDTDLVDSTVYLSLNSRKSFSFFFYRDGVLSDVSVFGALIFWNGSARPVYISRSGVGSYLFDYDFAGLSGKVTVSVVMDGVVRSVDLFVDDSTGVDVARIRSGVVSVVPFASSVPPLVLFVSIIVFVLFLVSLVVFFTRRRGQNG